MQRVEPSSSRVIRVQKTLHRTVEFTDEAIGVLVNRLRKSRGKDIWLMGGGDPTICLLRRSNERLKLAGHVEVSDFSSVRCTLSAIR